LKRTYARFKMNVFEIDSKVDTILTDIEGTTTSISFVKVTKSTYIHNDPITFLKQFILILKEILFPYARNALEEYLVKNITTEECQNDLILLRKQVFFIALKLRILIEISL
jgi:methionine salvage enolase-phosphatase E1